MFEAISGALALAPVVNTLLRRPGDADMALEFYSEKLRADFIRMARTGRDFYRQEGRWPDSPFWGERQRWPDEQPSHRPAGAPRIERRAVSDRDLIRKREVIVTGDHPRGIWRVAGVPLVELLRFMHAQGNGSSSPAVSDAAQRFRVPPEAVMTASQWLRWRGLLPR
jgi:hypothetical protein